MLGVEILLDPRVSDQMAVEVIRMPDIQRMRESADGQAIDFNLAMPVKTSCQQRSFTDT